MAERLRRKILASRAAIGLAVGAAVAAPALAAGHAQADSKAVTASECPPPSVKPNSSVSTDRLLQAEAKAMTDSTDRVIHGKTLRYIGCIAYLNKDDGARKIIHPLQVTENGINMIGYFNAWDLSGQPLFDFVSVNEVSGWSLDPGDSDSIQGRSGNQVLIPKITDSGSGVSLYDPQHPFNSHRKQLLDLSGQPLEIGMSNDPVPAQPLVPADPIASSTQLS